MTASLLGMLMLALAPGTAFACSCVQTTTADMFEQADIAFVGEEMGRAEFPRGAGPDAWATQAVTFRVVEAYKGEVTAEFTVFTGSGGGDCGVGPLTGLVGITTHTDDGGRPTINICGSVHSAGALASLGDPVSLAGSDAPPPPAASTDGWVPVVIAASAAGLAGFAFWAARRRSREWQDGWSNPR